MAVFGLAQLRKNKTSKRMNKLKRLFSPRALATTLAGGMLLHASLTALADTCQWFSTADWSPSGIQCTKYCTPTGEHPYSWFRGGELYWCCGASDYCGANTELEGQCCQN